MSNFKINIFKTEIEDSELPLYDFYYQGFWESDDTVHDPDINSWVDYIGSDGLLYREMIGPVENGCQLVSANSIVDTKGCSPCTP